MKISGFSNEDIEAIRGSSLFDARWYLDQYPDVKALGMDPVEHYLWLGARLGRNPSPQFDTNDYLRHSGASVGNSNPLIHCLHAMRANRTIFHNEPNSFLQTAITPPALSEPAPGPTLSADFLSYLKLHIDEEWYQGQLGMHSTGVDLKTHFLEIGWNLGLTPNRWFDTLGYVAAYKDVAKAGVNPFVHFMRSGLAEGRSPNPFFESRYPTHSDLKRFGPVEYGPVNRILKFSGDYPSLESVSNRLCVHVHAYYINMMSDVVQILWRISRPYTLLISVPEHADAEHWTSYFGEKLPFAEEVVVKRVPNRGRDVAPWLIYFRDEIRQHDIFCHFHAKRSPHSSDHKHWFRYLSHCLLGSEQIVNQILSLFATESSIGLVTPAYWPLLRRQPNFGYTERQFRQLCSRMGFSYRYDFCPDFPAGSFFWCRTAMLDKLFALGLELEDFSEEAGQVCGTLAHAIERIMGALPQESGLKSAFVAIDCPHEQVEHQSLSLKFAQEELLTASTLTVSVIIPTWNRRTCVAEAVRSALYQSYVPKEVFVVDDGSNDGTVEYLEDLFDSEMREGILKILRTAHKGVSAARNAGLEASNGDIIAYLDSDNTWRREYLAHMVTAFERYPKAISAYANFLSHDLDLNRTVLYDKQYQRAELLKQNFIDLNAFVHRRTVVLAGQRFDDNLKRLVDWDFILRVTARLAPLHIQYIGVDYNLDADRLHNITRVVPLEENMERVRRKFRHERVYWGDEPLSIVIKCPAPNAQVAHEWGDWHFAKSLCRSLERRGCRTRIDFLNEWDTAERDDDDVILALRGLSRYTPKPGKINLIWMISHPDKIDVEELKTFDHVFVASYQHTLSLMPALGAKISALLQCTDVDLFGDVGSSTSVPPHDVLFVGNSRGVDRWIPKLAVQRGLPIQVYGAGWESRLPPQVVKGTHVDNSQLGAFYSSAKIVLNDHWPSMATHGFISNRIFDAGLSGALVISDCFEGAEIFFGNVITCKDADEVERSVRYYIHDEEARREKAGRLQQIVRASHTFDKRAESIIKVARALFVGHRLDIPTGPPISVSEASCDLR